MKKTLITAASFLLLGDLAFAQSVHTNPQTNDIWTYFGPTLGGGWGAPFGDIVPPIQGGTGLNTVLPDQVPVGTALNIYTAKTIANCNDTVGNHINYDQSTHTFSCGKTSSTTPFNIRDYGAVGNGVTDDSTAIQAAITAAGNSIVFFPKSNAAYCVKSKVTVNASPWLLGESVPGSVLSACNTDTTVLEILNNSTTIQNLQILGRGSNPTDTFSPITKPTVTINCSGCRILHSFIYGGTNALAETGGGDLRIEDSSFAWAYGNALVYLQGQAWITRSSFDQGFPVQQSCCGNVTIGAWQASHSYNVGDWAATQGYIIQASQGGTSGGSAPTLQVYNKDIIDGTVKWRLAGQSTYYGIQMDTGATQLIISQMDIGGTYSSSIGMTDTLSGGAPFYMQIADSNIGGGLNSEIDIVAGGEVYLTGNTFGSCTTSSCSIIRARSTATGDLNIVGNKIFQGSYGVLIDGGVNTIIKGNIFGGLNLSAIYINSGVTDFIVSGNIAGSSPVGGVNARAVTVNTGASDRYIITDNITKNATIPGVSDAGSGTNKTVANNQ